MSCRRCYYFRRPADAQGYNDYDDTRPGECLRFPTAVSKYVGDICGEFRLTHLIIATRKPIFEEHKDHMNSQHKELCLYRDRALKAEKKLKELRAKQRAAKTKPQQP